MNRIEKFVMSVTIELKKKGFKPTAGYDKFMTNAVKYIASNKDVEFSAEFGRIINELGLGSTR